MMRRYLMIALLLIVAGCQAPSQPTLCQVSLIDALLAGQYDGVVTVGQVKRRGDFGLGTFDKLDGEMIVLDGTVYRAAADGSVEGVGPEVTTPFAAVVRFKPQRTVPLQGGGLDQVHAQLDSAIGNLNMFHAVRVRATCATLTLRSVPAQSPPYRPLAEVVTHQSVWTHEQITGTFVGLRCPDYAAGLNVPGYHWHFLSDDRRIGGHVLTADLRPCSAAVALVSEWHVILPTDHAFGQVDLQANRAQELERVEK